MMKEMSIWSGITSSAKDKKDTDNYNGDVETTADLGEVHCIS